MSLLKGEWIDDIFESDSGVGDGSTVTYFTSQPIQSQKCVSVSLNGLLLIYTTDYSVNLSNNSITFVAAPAVAQNINVKYIKKG